MSFSSKPPGKKRVIPAGRLPLTPQQYFVSKTRKIQLERAAAMCAVCTHEHSVLFEARISHSESATQMTCDDCSHFCIICQQRLVKDLFKERPCPEYRTGGYDSDPEYGYAANCDFGFDHHAQLAYHICKRCSSTLAQCDHCARVCMPFERALTRLSNGGAYCKFCLLKTGLLCANIRCQQILKFKQKVPLCSQCIDLPYAYCHWCYRFVVDQLTVIPTTRYVTMELFAKPYTRRGHRYSDEGPAQTTEDLAVPSKYTPIRIPRASSFHFVPRLRHSLDGQLYQNGSDTFCLHCANFCQRCKAPSLNRHNIRSTSGRTRGNWGHHRNAIYCDDCNRMLDSVGLVGECFDCLTFDSSKVTYAIGHKVKDHYEACSEGVKMFPNTQEARSLLIALLVVDGGFDNMIEPLLQGIIDTILGPLPDNPPKTAHDMNILLSNTQL